MVNAKKGLSAKQLERDLGISYPTAWYLAHRIRKAMEEGHPGLLTGTVEADETYVGGRHNRQHGRRRRHHQSVMGFLERSKEDRCSQVRAFPLPTNSTAILTGAVTNNVSPKAELFISQSHDDRIRPQGRPAHDLNERIEDFGSVFERGLTRSYPQSQRETPGSYLNEFAFRFNNRDAKDLFGL